jgi:hypothetical protein
MGQNPNSITSHNQSLLNRLPSPHSSEKKQRDIEMCRDVRYNDEHLMVFSAFSRVLFPSGKEQEDCDEGQNSLPNKEFPYWPYDAFDPGLRH